MRIILAIMHNETPTRAAQLPPSVHDTDVHRAYGFACGYEFALAKMASLGLGLVADEELEMKFESDLED